jgi:arsenate reductase
VKATIWHHPGCSKSRAALALLAQHGAEVTVVDYRRNPPGRDALRRLFARAGVAATAALRPDAPAAADEAEALALLDVNSALLERPFVETERGAALCRPPERVLALL